MRPLYPSLARLRALRVVCETGSFSAAAGQLFLTQPAISAQIRQLEKETGVQLVERLGKRAKATPEGTVLINSTKRIFEELDSALERVADMQGETSGPLHIGAGATATTHLLPGLLADLEGRYPKIKVQVMTGNTPEMLQKLREASLDIAILTAPIRSPDVSQRPFYEDQLVCLAPTGDVRGRSHLQPQDFRDKRLILYEPGGFIRQAIDDWFTQTEAGPSDILSIGSADGQVSFVRAGFGWSIISEVVAEAEAARGGLAFVPLEPVLSRQLLIVWRTDRADRPTIAASVELLTAFARSKKRAFH